MTDRPTPTWTPIYLACDSCGHQWVDWQPSGVPAATWIAHAKTYRCRGCGNGWRALGIRPT